MNTMPAARGGGCTEGPASGMGQARPRAKPVRALALTVLVVSGIVLTDMAALREHAVRVGQDDARELSMTSYFDSLAQRDAAAADRPRNSVQLALLQAGAVPSPSTAREEVSEQASKALGGGLEAARRGAARREEKTSAGVHTRPRQREASDIAADMKDMLRSVCHSHSVSATQALETRGGGWLLRARSLTRSPLPCALYQHKAAFRQRPRSCEFARRRGPAARDAGHEGYR